MKNLRTPRTMADSHFAVGYPEKRPRNEGAHPSTWVVIALGLLGLAIVWWTR